MTISADQFASHRLSQQHLTVEKAVKQSWLEIERRINSGFMDSGLLNIAVKEGNTNRERFPNHDERVAQLLIKKLNHLGYWVRAWHHNTWLDIKWSHKKPCSFFTWYPPT